MIVQASTHVLNEFYGWSSGAEVIGIVYPGVRNGKTQQTPSHSPPASSATRKATSPGVVPKT